MSASASSKLSVGISASQARKRLRGYGFGVRRVQAVDRNRAAIVHTATGEHLRELERLFADVLESSNGGNAPQKVDELWQL